MTYGDIRRG